MTPRASRTARGIAVAIAMLALSVSAETAAAQTHEVGHWMGLHHTFSSRASAQASGWSGWSEFYRSFAVAPPADDLPAPPPAQPRHLLSGHKFQLQRHVDSRTKSYHRPKSFQIISAGKNRR